MMNWRSLTFKKFRDFIYKRKKHKSKIITTMIMEY